MIISDKNVAIANELRGLVQSRTETVDDGQGVAMVLLWTFLSDHARFDNIDVADLAREQIEAFVAYAKTNLTIARHH